MSEHLIHIKASHQCGSEQCIQGGNKLGEATASNVLGRNESEWIEPRNVPCHGGRCFHFDRRQYSYLRKRRADKNSIGVLGNGMVQDGCCLNLGDPFISFETIGFKSTCKQVLKHENAWKNKWKSELLILLGAWESQVHGEAAAEMKLEEIRLVLNAHRGTTRACNKFSQITAIAVNVISGSRMWANHKYGSEEGVMAIKFLIIGG